MAKQTQKFIYVLKEYYYPNDIHKYQEKEPRILYYFKDYNSAMLFISKSILLGPSEDGSPLEYYKTYRMKEVNSEDSPCHEITIYVSNFRKIDHTVKKDGDTYVYHEELQPRYILKKMELL